jgi:prepilin-type N-terminal cleavage/methylation domain-containing protein
MCLGDDSGFTLVELLVGMVVISIFMLGTFVFQHNMLAFSHQGAARLELQQQGTLALEYMIRGLREASVVDIDDYEGGIDNGIAVVTPKGQQEYWSVENPGDREDNLYMNLGGGEELLIGDYAQGGFGIKVDDLSFSDNYDGVNPVTNTVDINLDLKLVDLSADPAVILETMNFNAQVQPRNRE